MALVTTYAETSQPQSTPLDGWSYKRFGLPASSSSLDITSWMIALSLGAAALAFFSKASWTIIEWVSAAPDLCSAYLAKWPTPAAWSVHRYSPERSVA